MCIPGINDIQAKYNLTGPTEPSIFPLRTRKLKVYHTSTYDEEPLGHRLLVVPQDQLHQKNRLS